MKIVKSTDGNWLEKEGYSKKIFFDQIEPEGIVVQNVKIKPGEKALSHHHKIQTEVFYFLNNNGTWAVNGEKLEMKAGDVLVIEPMDKHEVSNDTAEDCLYVAFKYNYDPDDLYWD